MLSNLKNVNSVLLRLTNYMLASTIIILWCVRWRKDNKQKVCNKIQLCEAFVIQSRYAIGQNQKINSYCCTNFELLNFNDSSAVLKFLFQCNCPMIIWTVQFCDRSTQWVSILSLLIVVIQLKVKHWR